MWRYSLADVGKELPWSIRWARWWLWLWGIVAVGLLAALFLIEFKWWVAAALGFGVMEGMGLMRPRDPCPPLTETIHKFVPPWMAFTAIYGFVGAAGGVGSAS